MTDSLTNKLDPPFKSAFFFLTIPSQLKLINTKNVFN